MKIDTRMILLQDCKNTNYGLILKKISIMPTFSISENNESLFYNCRVKKMSETLNIRLNFSQHIGTCKSAYTKGYALN